MRAGSNNAVFLLDPRLILQRENLQVTAGADHVAPVPTAAAAATAGAAGLAK